MYFASNVENYPQSINRVLKSFNKESSYTIAENYGNRFLIMKITIIGAGNIGGAIARGLVRGGVFNASDITCTDLMQANLDRLLSADACFNVSQDNPTAIQGADLVVIAVKPWRVEAVIDEIRGALDYERQSVVSVAAGIPFERLLRYFTKDAVTRYLPCS